jgi:hypothetical protein
MTCEDIISRAAYNVGDEFYKEISQDEYLRMLRRTYRDFCEKTKLLRNVISFTTTANVKSYKLYGNDENGRLFGDNFLGTYRVEWSSDGISFRKAYETDLDSIKNGCYDGGFADIDDSDIMHDSHPLFYTINYFQDALWVIFTNLIAGSLTIKLWYYELPKITDLVDLNATPMFDQKYHDKLVQGLELKAWERRYVKAVAMEKPTQVLNILAGERERIKGEWKIELEKIHEEVMALKDDTIPIVVMPAIAFSMLDSNDTNNEQDDNLI